MRKLSIVALLLASLLSTGAAKRQMPNVEEASISDLRAGLDAGKFTSRDLVEAYFARVTKLDPSLHAVIERNPDVLAIADQLDRERKEHHLRGPLHGIPIMIKDNIDTADRMQTTAGSLALAGTHAPHDAFVVEQLRAAGAIIIAKTNMSEWANFRSTHSSSGWSGRGGQAHNPYALDRNTSGSSSGSAAATAASLAAAAVGSETDGSIVSPSSVCGIVGIKPTLGLVSRSGIIPIAASQDTAGPMARTVADAATLLSAMTGVDPRDELTATSRDHIAADYTKFLNRDALRGARIGIVRSKSFSLGPKNDKVLDAAIAAMKAAGATVVDPVEIKSLDEPDDSEGKVLRYEFKDEINRYLATRPDLPVHSLEDLIRWNKEHASTELQWFGQELFEQSQEKGPLTSQEYRDALAKDLELTRTKGIDAALAANHLDALVSITNGPAWPIDLVNGDSYTGGSSSLAAVAGYPSITVPAGFVDGLPIGLSFTAEAWSEPKLIGFAYSFEQATHARKPPRYPATIPETR